MNFEHMDVFPLSSLAHINSHVSYLLTCDSKAGDDPYGYAEANIIAFYEDDELQFVNGYDLTKRTSLAKKIRKLAKDNLKSLTDRYIEKHLKMELSYLQGLSEYNIESDEGFEEMAKYIFDYIEAKEEKCKSLNEETFLYVFHLHQNQMPHLHRFFKVN